jgi:hypothetical protein
MAMRALGIVRLDDLFTVRKGFRTKSARQFFLSKGTLGGHFFGKFHFGRGIFGSTDHDGGILWIIIIVTGGVRGNVVKLNRICWHGQGALCDAVIGRTRPALGSKFILKIGGLLFLSDCSTG